MDQYLMGAIISSWGPSFSSAVFSALTLNFVNCFFLSYATWALSFLFLSSSCKGKEIDKDLDSTHKQLPIRQKDYIMKTMLKPEISLNYDMWET